MSFHKCGGNVGDDVTIPLPQWALSVAKSNDLLYKDQWNHQNEEYISAGADNEKVFPAANGGLRTPLTIYKDFMSAFASKMKKFIDDGTIDDIQIGAGPCGELRYPAYPSDRWTYPGIGAFQCWDSNMLADFRSKAKAAGHSEWTSPPTDAGSYNNTPDSQPFFRDGYKTDYGKFFLSWYQGVLETHAQSLLKIGDQVFGSLSKAIKVAGIHWWYGHASHAAELTAGYNNAKENAYENLEDVFGKAHFDFTCLEMTDAEHSGENCYSKPEELVRQAIDAVKVFGGSMCGENALEMYTRNKYQQVLNNLKYAKGYFSAFTYLRLNDKLLNQYMDDYKWFVSEAGKI